MVLEFICLVWLCLDVTSSLDYAINSAGLVLWSSFFQSSSFPTWLQCLISVVLLGFVTKPLSIPKVPLINPLTSQTFPPSGTDPHKLNFFWRSIVHIYISHLCGLSIISWLYPLLQMNKCPEESKAFLCAQDEGDRWSLSLSKCQLWKLWSLKEAVESCNLAF